MKTNLKQYLTGFACGLTNGLFGAGGGAIAVPALERFLGAKTHKAHATAVAAVLPLTAVSLMFYSGEISAGLGTLALISLGGAAGGLAGARLLRKLPAKALHKILGIFLAAAALRMIF